MKKFLAAIIISATMLAATVAAQPSPPIPKDPSDSPQSAKMVAAAPDVLVELSLLSGDVVVRGWDRGEVRARSAEAPRIELRQYEAHDVPKVAGKAAGPARRVEVFIFNSDAEEVRPGEIRGSGNVELDVPAGATVVLKLQSGDVEISGVAEARVESWSGDIDISRISRGVDVKLFSGDVHIEETRGGVRVKSQSGTVEAAAVTPNDNRDVFVVNSMSGDIRLEAVGHAKVEAKTLSGSLSFEGPLAPKGGYKLQSYNGDVTLAIPGDSAFSVSARVVIGGDIVTDFSIKPDPKTPKTGPGSRLEGAIGAGDRADVSLVTYSGTIFLRKQ